MKTKWFRPTRVEIAVILCLVGVAAALLLPNGHQVAWNAGARERLDLALRLIAKDWVRSKEDVDKLVIDLEDFVPRRVDKSETRVPGSMLNERHGISVPWHRDGHWRNLDFYPLALCSTVHHSSGAAPVPIIAMVPIDVEDKETLPALHGCALVEQEQLMTCQLQGMKDRFLRHGVADVATLNSDGTVWFVTLPDLFDQRLPANRRARGP